MHTSRKLTTILRTDTTPVVAMRATESRKCQPGFTTLADNVFSMLLFYWSVFTNIIYPPRQWSYQDGH